MTYSLHAAFYRLPPQQQSGDVAERIAAELAKLAREAKEANLPTLAYLIECARIEAKQAAGNAD